jgi:hypothetical protein
MPTARAYSLGRQIAVWFTKAHGRVLTPGLAWTDPTLPDDIAARSPLAVTWRAFDRALDQFIADQMLGAPSRTTPTPPCTRTQPGRTRSRAA